MIKDGDIVLQKPEEKGFEPLRRVTDLLVFEARPFSLLGTPPYNEPHYNVFFYIVKHRHIFYPVMDLRRTALQLEGAPTASMSFRSLTLWK